MTDAGEGRDQAGRSRWAVLRVFVVSDRLFLFDVHRLDHVFSKPGMQVPAWKRRVSASLRASNRFAIDRIEEKDASSVLYRWLDVWMGLLNGEEERLTWWRKMGFMKSNDRKLGGMKVADVIIRLNDDDDVEKSETSR